MRTEGRERLISLWRMMILDELFYHYECRQSCSGYCCLITLAFSMSYSVTLSWELKVSASPGIPSLEES